MAIHAVGHLHSARSGANAWPSALCAIAAGRTNGHTENAGLRSHLAAGRRTGDLSLAGSGKILAHIHTFNDEGVIQTCLRSVLDQSHPVNQINVVDNASTDGTLALTFPADVTIVPSRVNLGPGGATRISLEFGLKHGYDWVWVLDADSAPHRDALQKLLELFDSFSPAQKERTGWLSCLPVGVEDGKPHHGLIITPGSYVTGSPSKTSPWYECDVSSWTGTLFRLKAIRKAGLPSFDYISDMGDFEYGYRLKNAGFVGWMHTESVMDHDIGGISTKFVQKNLGPLTFRVLSLPPIRAYYFIRNNLYFWLYLYHGPQRYRVRLLRLLKCAKFFPNAILAESHRRELFLASLRGYWDGVFGRMEKRF